MLLSIVNGWEIGGSDGISVSSENNKDNGSLANFVSEISEGVSTQLHIGIMKAARRVMLEEIISNIILEFCTSKKAQRQPRPDLLKNAVKTCSSKSRMVIYKTPSKFLIF